MHHHLNKKLDKQRKPSVKVPKLKILWNKRKHKRRNELGLTFYSLSGDKDMEASYLDLGLEELEEVREGAGEGSNDSILGGLPCPNIWARSQATVVVLLLNGDLLVNIKSEWTPYDYCYCQVDVRSTVSPLVSCLVSFLSLFPRFPPYYVPVGSDLFGISILIPSSILATNPLPYLVSVMGY